MLHFNRSFYKMGKYYRDCLLWSFVTQCGISLLFCACEMGRKWHYGGSWTDGLLYFYLYTMISLSYAIAGAVTFLPIFLLHKRKANSFIYRCLCWWGLPVSLLLVLIAVTLKTGLSTTFPIDIEYFLYVFFSVVPYIAAAWISWCRFNKAYPLGSSA